MKKYSDESIKTLDAREHVRLRVGNYTGGNFDPTHLVKEIYYNSQDEHEIGNGNKIIITYNTSDNIFSIEDEGQGFPVGVIRSDGKTILQAAADTLNTSGKFDGDIYNNNVTGLNGQGLKITNFLSEYLDIYTTNGSGKAESIHFENGEFVSREYFNVDKSLHGTKITWKPDASFFQNSLSNIDELKKLFVECAALHPKLTIEFIVDDNKILYHSEHGLEDLLNSLVEGNELLQNRFVISRQENNAEGSNRVDIALTYSYNYSEKIIPYVNAAITESGAHISALKYLLVTQLNKYALTNNIIKKESDKLNASEISEGLVIVFNIKVNNVIYTGQAKEKVSNIDTSLLRQVINGDFAAWLINNPKDARLIIDRALTARKAKEAAQNAKDRIRNATNKGKKFISLPTKLVDAYSKDRSECELFITEGDSARNGLVAKRDGKTQAVFPIRGKILSCRKAAPDKVYANQEISNIVKALGLDIDKETGKLIYNIKKLRYGKIIFAADRDPDGYSIRMLLLNVFWWLCPELVENGHIYVAVPPLFRVTDKNNNYIYFKGEKELEKYKANHKGSFLINRMKGLGEMSPSELAECLLKNQTRNVQQIVSPSFKETDDMLEIFMGQKVDARRDYLLQHYNEVDID